MTAYDPNDNDKNDAIRIDINLSNLVSSDQPEPPYDGILSDIYRRDVTEWEMAYLLSRYPFLVIANDDVSSYLYQLPKTLKLKGSDWQVKDYFHQFICAPGQFHGEREGAGTLEAQGLATVRALLAEAKKREWESMRIMEGSTDRLARYAWILGEEAGMLVHGYSPSPHGKVVAARHAHLNKFGSIEQLRSAVIRPGSRFGSSSEDARGVSDDIDDG